MPNKLTKAITPFVNLPAELLFCSVMGLANLLPRVDLFDRIRFLFLRLLGIKGTRSVYNFGANRSVALLRARQNNDDPCIINSGVRFAVPAGGSITIEECVAIGPRVQFECMNHGLRFVDGARPGAQAGHIFVGREAWIGAACVIFSNVRIGRGAVIAAGSVVNRDIPPYTLAAGVPAVVKRSLRDQ